MSVTYVLIGATGAEIAGYYTLAATSVLLSDLPPAVAKRLPKYPAVPAILIGRLAVALNYRGQGLGELLLIDALRRSLQSSETIGATAVVTDAKDEEAASFYRRYDFQQCEGMPRRLFIPMGTVAQLFG
ncbi:MAG TPA: GNAT family N-acetyltransferase [Gemmatimonadales bacterium]|nr:GNAT family N-acetyltransferase [Gemmatimonadales bacterium]